MNGYGVQGEVLAREYLESKGYDVLDVNYTTKLGEIDVVARQGSYVVFIEVKSRLSKRFGAPMEAVNREKQRKYVKTAELYLIKKKLTGCDVRFDVIEVFADKINHVENAFWAN